MKRNNLYIRYKLSELIHLVERSSIPCEEKNVIANGLAYTLGRLDICICGADKARTAISGE